MLNRLLLALSILATFSGPVHAQVIKQDALKLAEIAMNDAWEVMVPALNMMFEGLTQQARNTRGAGPAAPIFIEELRRVISKENMTKASAALYSEHMTDLELKEALAFTTSPTGRKFASLANPGQITKFMAPMLREACTKTRGRLTASNLPADPQMDKMCGV